MRILPSSTILASLFIALAPAARGNVQTPVIFGDHMVLQQDLKLPVWGTAEPGEKVEVTVGTHKATATAGADGKWMARLDPLPVSATPVEMRVSGKNTLTFTDVLVGDVWLAAGQSNMEFGIGNAANTKEVIPTLNYPAIRLFLVPRNFAMEPQADIKQDGLKGHWVVLTPESVIKIGGWNGFSAVALFFGLDLYKHRQQPLGLIEAAWGGTPVKDWTSLETLKSIPMTAHYGPEHDDMKAHLAEIKAKYTAEDLPKWQVAHDAWKKEVAALAPGAAKPKEPVKPTPIDEYPQQPAVLFDGMIHPLIPYGIKGVAWYQGESNGGPSPAAEEYYQTLEGMIKDWRHRWGQGDYPFLITQCTPWGGGWYWIAIRQMQIRALELPRTGMVVTMDVGDQNDVHPKNKITVGERLALVARHLAYGENIVYSGPLYSSSKMDGDKATVTFDHVGGGLVIGSAPTGRADQPPAPPAAQLNGFELAGKDKNVFYPAQARIEGDTVVVTSDKVKEAHYVRFGCYNFPPAPLNLYNKEGLPASPFSTSNDPVWPVIPK